jgi:hypothetical protein
MKKRTIFLIAITTLIIASCSKEGELQKSIFIEDPEFPDLPQYSEWGYNTFGAYYDRQAFVSYGRVPVKVICTNDTTSLILIGQLGSYYYSEDKISITFKFPRFLPDKYTNLTILNDSIFDLTNPDYRVIISINDDEFDAQVFNGNLHFKRVQNLIVDKKETEVILSGVFEFQALIDNEPVTMSDGRFDVGVGYDNFFKY